MPRRQSQKGPGRPLRGWIQAHTAQPAEAEYLRRLGVKVGCFNPEMARFDNCVVDRVAFDKLEPLCGIGPGKFLWSLK